MRITGGLARGIHLHRPPGSDLRPTTDALREAIFSVLGGRVAGASFADLFAGVGSYGLEACSRGAVRGIFVEKDRRNLDAVEKNLRAVVESAAIDPAPFVAHRGDAFRWRILPVDLLFVDPPYDLIREKFFECRALLERWIAVMPPTATIVLEMPGDLDFAEGPALRRLRTIGKCRRGEPVVALIGRNL